MKNYSQTSAEIGDFSKLPLLQKYALADLLYVAYGLLIVALVLVSYILGMFDLLPHDPQQINMELLMAPPASGGYLLGTDFMGRDILSRLIVGIQAYFLPGLLAIFISLTGGVVLGILSGYWDGKLETVITYLTNLVDSFPRLVLILLVIAAFKPDIYYIMVVMGITGVPTVATAIANKIRFLAQKNFIEAALALGLRRRAIIFKHILWYNCRALLIIQATLGMGEAILLETSLSYLGFGVQEPVPSWGNMVQSGANYFCREIAMIFQNPRASLNPYVTVGEQITESVRLHTAYKSAKEARERAIYWLEQVKIDTPRLRFNSYPSAMSGGMCQRAMIAMALSSEPSLLIADEPTTGLDATIQSKIVDLMEELKSETGISTLLISHDISVISRLADRVAVMYGGAVVEYGPAQLVLDMGAALKHPYTAALLASVPSAQKIRDKANLQTIEGDVLDTINVPSGCRFYARCNQVTAEIREKCASQHPALQEVAPGHQMRCWRFGN